MTKNRKILILNVSFAILGIAAAVGMTAGCILSRQFLEIVKKGDNIPIVGMMYFVGFFSWLSLKQAFLTDQRIEEGRRDLIYDDMCD